MSYMPQSKSDTHLTPDIIYEKMRIFTGKSREQLYDPCPEGTPFKSPCFFNGLYGEWQPWNFVNPPYGKGKLEAFVVKAIEQKNLHGHKTWMLLPSKTDQPWFHKLQHWWDKIIWIRRRLKFKNNKHHATQPHFLVLIQ